jgi:hypothetical protein
MGFSRAVKCIVSSRRELGMPQNTACLVQTKACQLATDKRVSAKQSGFYLHAWCYRAPRLISVVGCTSLLFSTPRRPGGGLKAKPTFLINETLRYICIRPPPCTSVERFG